MKIAILVIALGLTGCVAQGPVVNQSDVGKIVNCSSKFYNPNVKCYKEAPKQTVEQMQANFDEAIRPDESAQAYRNSDVITREEKLKTTAPKFGLIGLIITNGVLVKMLRWSM